MRTALAADGPFPISECRTCRKPIIWTVTGRNKPAPVDAAPVVGGRIALTWQRQPGLPAPFVAARVVPTHLAFGVALYTSHFANCKDADTWRRPR